MKVFKIYKPKPPQKVVRIEIIEKGSQSKTITLDEKDTDSVLEGVKNILNKDFKTTTNPLEKPHKVIIKIFEAQGLKKSNSKSMTIYGFGVISLYNILMNHVEK
jgi:hypothetical protein